MDATPASKKATPAAAVADAVPPAAQQAAEQLSSPESDAGVRASGSEDDDEQVERFYALLDNIRAMRGMVSTGGAASGRKRARDEPPWRPAFRMEDFELEEFDSGSAGCDGGKNKRESSIAKRPADEEEQAEVVEAKGPRCGPRPPQSHKPRREGVRAVDT